MSFNSKTINFKAGFDTSQVATGTQKIQGYFSRLEKTTAKLSNIMTGAFAAGAISGALIGATNFAKLGGEIEGVENAFRKMAQAGDLEKLRQATRGMVSDLELMRQANFARSVGIDMQQLAQAMAYAQRYASATGKAMSEIMSDATMEMIRQTGLRLDNIGLSIEKVKERAKEIGFIPAMLEQMAENTKKFGSETLTTAERIQQMQTKVENVKNFLAGAFSKSLVTVGVIIETLIERFGLAFDILRIGFVNSIGSIFQRLFEAGVTLSTMFGPAGALGRGLISTFAGFADFQKEIIGDTSKVKTWADTWKEVAAIWRGKGAMGGFIPQGANGGDGGGTALTDSQIDEMRKKLAEANKVVIEEYQSFKKEFEDMLNKEDGIPSVINTMAESLTNPEALGRLRGSFLIITDEFRNLTDSMNTAIEQYLESAIVDVFSRLGEGLVGAARDVENWGNQMLASFGGFLQQMGAMIISYAFAMDAFKKAFKDPVTAIAAGAALVAIGAAIKKTHENKMGGSGGGGSAGVPSSSFNQGYNFESRLDGYDLVLVSDRNQRLRTRRG